MNAVRGAGAGWPTDLRRCDGVTNRRSWTVVRLFVGFGSALHRDCSALQAGNGFLQVATSLRGVINRAGGVILIVMGVLLFTGSWTAPFAPVLRWYTRLGWPPI